MTSKEPTAEASAGWADFVILDLAADRQGRGAPRSLSRRLPTLVAAFLDAAGSTVRRGSAFVPLGDGTGETGAADEQGDAPRPRRGWALAAGMLEDGEAIAQARPLGRTRYLVHGEIAPAGPAGLRLRLRALHHRDGGEALRLEKDFFEEETLRIAREISRALAELVSRADQVDALDDREIAGTTHPEALLRLMEGMDGLAAVEAGLEGSDRGLAVERLFGALELDRDCRPARDAVLREIVAAAGRGEASLPDVSPSPSIAASPAHEGARSDRPTSSPEPDRGEASRDEQGDVAAEGAHVSSERHGRAASAEQGERSSPDVLEWARRLADLRPGDPEVVVVAARLLRRRGEMGEASRRLAKALELRPTSPRLALELARTHADRGDLEATIEICKETIGKCDERSEGGELAELLAELHAELGLAWARSGHYEDAAESLRRSLELRSDRPVVLANLARCLDLLGDHSGALQTYRRSLELEPGAWEVIRNAADLLLRLGSLDEAVPLLRRWLEARPAEPEPALALAESLLHLGRPDEAVTTLRDALDHCPDDPRLHALLGGVSAHRGDLDEAADSYRRALSLDGDDYALLSNLALVLARKGELDEALPLAERAAALSPTDAVSRRVLDYVRSLKTGQENER